MTDKKNKKISHELKGAKTKNENSSIQYLVYSNFYYNLTKGKKMIKSQFCYQCRMSGYHRKKYTVYVESYHKLNGQVVD